MGSGSGAAGGGEADAVVETAVDGSEAPDGATTDASDDLPDEATCEGVACNAPPPNECENETQLRVYETTGTCDRGECYYGWKLLACPNACEQGACAGDPCMGTTCNTPPPPYCSDPSHARVSDAPGTCNGGACSYPTHEEYCQFGCANNVCNGDPCVGIVCSTPPANYCAGPGDLVVFDPDDYCGAACAPCSGTTPACDGLACVCSATSCGPNRVCQAGACAVCKSDSSCGITCAACPQATPRCLDQGSTSTFVRCLTTAACSSTDICAGNSCVPSGCPQPVEACSSGSQSRRGCSNAQVVGRVIAASTSGFYVSANTCSAYDDSEGPNASGCWDYGDDHTYRIWMRANERIDVTITQGSKCCDATSWDRVFKIYSGSACDDKTCASKLLCTSTGSGTFTRSFTAPTDTWYFLVVDGRTSAYKDSGTYGLTVKLTCSTSSCGCLDRRASGDRKDVEDGPTATTRDGVYACGGSECDRTDVPPHMPSQGCADSGSDCGLELLAPPAIARTNNHVEPSSDLHAARAAVHLRPRSRLWRGLVR